MYEHANNGLVCTKYLSRIDLSSICLIVTLLRDYILAPCYTPNSEYNKNILYMRCKMNTKTKSLLNKSPEKTAKVALSVFFNITDAWGVKSDEQRILLGSPASSTLFKWKKGEASKISVDTLERISYIMGIYKALGILFPTREQADAWIKKANRDFDGQTALSFMLKGSMVNLSDTRRYLDAQRG